MALQLCLNTTKKQGGKVTWLTRDRKILPGKKAYSKSRRDFLNLIPSVKELNGNTKKKSHKTGKDIKEVFRNKLIPLEVTHIYSIT